MGRHDPDEMAFAQGRIAEAQPLVSWFLGLEDASGTGFEQLEDDAEVLGLGRRLQIFGLCARR